MISLLQRVTGNDIYHELGESILHGIYWISSEGLSLLFFSFTFISWRLITLHIIMGFVIHWQESAMDLHVFPILTPPPTSLLIPSLWVFPCTSPEHLSHASNLGWQSVSHLIIYMFQCYSLKSSHPRLPPQSPKVCSIHLCLFFCFASRSYRYHLSKFHIYALVYCIGVYLSGLLHSV